MSADDFILVAQSLSGSALRAIEFPAIQKGLREFVLAHLIRDAVDDSRVSVHAVSSSSNRGIAGNNHSNNVVVSQFIGASKAGLYQLSPKIFSSADNVSLIQALMTARTYLGGAQSTSSTNTDQTSDGFSPKIVQAAIGNSTRDVDGLNSRDRLSALVCLLICCGALNTSKHSITGDNFKRTNFLESHSKLISSTAISGRLGTSAHPFASKDACGFGTAPIWYQQSMATGPPIQAISLEPKRNRNCTWWTVEVMHFEIQLEQC
jgi:hypothetical protein